MGKKKRIPLLTRSAYHEAGHAVMCYLLRRRFSYVTIEGQKTDEINVTGSCKTEPFHAHFGDHLKKRRVFERAILTKGGGSAAEVVLTGQGKGRGIFSDGDLDQSIMLANFIARGFGEEAAAYVHWLWLRARNMLREPHAWVLVDALAKALLKEKYLGYRKARRIMDEAGKRYCEEIDREIKERDKR